MGAILSRDLDIYALDDPMSMAEIDTAVARLREFDGSTVDPEACNLAHYQMLFADSSGLGGTVALASGESRGAKLTAEMDEKRFKKKLCRIHGGTGASSPMSSLLSPRALRVGVLARVRHYQLQCHYQRHYCSCDRGLYHWISMK